VRHFTIHNEPLSSLCSSGFSTGWSQLQGVWLMRSSSVLFDYHFRSPSTCLLRLGALAFFGQRGLRAAGKEMFGQNKEKGSPD
jgi:hypothetical protein